MKSNSYIKSIKGTQGTPAKSKNTKEHAGTGYTCGECCKGKWSKEKNIFGKHFMVYCQYAQWAFSPRLQSNVVLSSHDACEQFLEGERTTETL